MKFSFSFDISVLLTTLYGTDRAYAGCCKGKVTTKSDTREIKQNPTADAKVVLCFEIFPKKANRNLSYKAVVRFTAPK